MSTPSETVSRGVRVPVKGLMAHPAVVNTLLSLLRDGWSGGRMRASALPVGVVSVSAGRAIVGREAGGRRGGVGRVARGD